MRQILIIYSILFVKQMCLKEQGHPLAGALALTVLVYTLATTKAGDYDDLPV